MGWRHSKGSESPSAISRQLEDTNAISYREAFEGGFSAPVEDQEHLGSIREGSGCKMEPVPLQRVSVAQSDQRQLDGTVAISEREAF
jgi:hypothetical protein